MTASLRMRSKLQDKQYAGCFLGQDKCSQMDTIDTRRRLRQVDKCRRHKGLRFQLYMSYQLCSRHMTHQPKRYTGLLDRWQWNSNRPFLQGIDNRQDKVNTWSGQYSVDKNLGNIVFADHWDSCFLQDTANKLRRILQSTCKKIKARKEKRVIF